LKTKENISGPEIRCPACGATLPHKWVKSAAGRLVGAIKGRAKAHSSEVARANVMARWAKVRALKKEES
jgi:hypothetical protein